MNAGTATMPRNMPCKLMARNSDVQQRMCTVEPTPAPVQYHIYYATAQYATRKHETSQLPFLQLYVRRTYGVRYSQQKRHRPLASKHNMIQIPWYGMLYRYGVRAVGLPAALMKCARLVSEDPGLQLASAWYRH